MAASGGSSWSPDFLFDASQVGVWYDPSDLATMWTDSIGGTAAAAGDPINVIEDKSGNNLHGYAPSSAGRPILRQTAGGLYYLEFDGADDYLQIGAVSRPLGNTINEFVLSAGYVERSRQTSSLFALSQDISSSNRSSRIQSHAPFSDGNGYFDVGGASGSTRVSGAWPVAAGNNLVATFKNSVSDSEQLFRVDGAQVAGDATGHSVTTNLPAYLCAQDPTGNGNIENFMAADVFGLVIVIEALSQSDIDDLENWLSVKTGA